MFKKATRSQTKINIALTGPSGAGKTLSALKLAYGLMPNPKVAVIDTENGSASLYSKEYEFDTVLITPPYTTEKYNVAIEAAVKGGYDVLIIDSISHAWSGEGGILAQKDAVADRGGNSWAAWAKLTPKQELFISKLLHSNIHLIATMRSKQEYVLTENSKGKQEPKKIGMAPIQREGLEYEFTVVFDIAMNHQAEASKDRTNLFKDRLFQIDEKTGHEIAGWLSGAEAEAAPASVVPEQKPPPAPVTPPKTSPAKGPTPAQNPATKTPAGAAPTPQTKPAGPPSLRQEMVAVAAKHGWSGDQVKEYIGFVYEVESTASMKDEQIKELINTMKTVTPEEALKAFREQLAEVQNFINQPDPEF